MSGSLYGRKGVLQVGTAGGAGLDLSALHFRFAVRKATIQTPNTCDVRIYNLSDHTAQTINNEYTQVVIQAGYENGPFGVIFQGTIKQVRRGRESATDTYVDIFGGSEMAYNQATVNKSISAGYSYEDVHSILLGAFGEIGGVTQGYTAPMPQRTFPRGRVMYGDAKDHARQLASDTGLAWSLQDNDLQFASLTQANPGTAIVLSSNTGMIGLPEQTQYGISVRSLLNPNIKSDVQVKIDQKSVQQVQRSQDYTALNVFPSVANDGLYRVLVAEHTGDTRGQAWYTDAVCLSLDDTLPIAVTQAGWIV